MDAVYFELNNWMPGENYPNEEPFLAWLKNDLNLSFLNEDWVEKNQLCVVAAHVDMSVNFCVTAKKEWVEKNCPKLLTEYTQFLREPEDDDEMVYGQFGHEFLPYEEDNIGISFASDEDEEVYWGDSDDDEYEDDEEEDDDEDEIFLW